VEIDSIIRMTETKALEDVYYMSVYLMEMVPFFKKNLEFQNTELMCSLAERMRYKRFKQNEVLVHKGEEIKQIYIHLGGSLISGISEDSFSDSESE